jgi:hypothetical protein
MALNPPSLSGFHLISLSPAGADNPIEMIYKKRRGYQGLPGGYFHFSMGNRTIFGPGDGEFIRLRDEFGNEWRGVAERQGDDTIRYRFRDDSGNHISGMSDGYGVVLRDSKGNTWRGFIE